ncbi:uncharacterized protein MELLADRAFT_59872 [Melampsora larici-populina 98AG31]|uniref:Secreted protein n=1 Tax=Melampsora larici-populina (strain 98AG31 / pathotype 3-4-7) TaxID=747676 RepID=F4R938_MELLP|nr:uncharacterized protein MELLADRAFT_59872 [Melampsora larici-populina 98AG31]EGG11222.1 hypothetical protein MELLADRAFT_59872 [Melampsora larici-populina 98AG31]
MEKQNIYFNLVILTLILVFCDLSVNGGKLTNEDEVEGILTQIESQIKYRNSAFNLARKPDRQIKETDELEANSRASSSSNLISDSNPNNQSPHHHHETADHLPPTPNQNTPNQLSSMSNQHSPDQSPSTSNLHSSKQLPSTSNIPSPSAPMSDLINQEVYHSIKTYDPNTKLDSLEPVDSKLLRKARTRLHLAYQSIKQTLNGPEHTDFIDQIRRNTLKSWSYILHVMKSADVNEVGIPTEFLKKVMEPVINRLILRDHNQILTFRYQGEAPVTRIVAIWAKFWRSLVNTDPKPILHDEYVTASMDWIINLILHKLPLDPDSVMHESSRDPTNIDLRVARFIVRPDGPDVLDKLVQDLFDINLQSHARQFYNVLIKYKEVSPSSLDYIMREADDQYRDHLFNQYKQFRQDQISLRCAASGLRRSDHQSGSDRISLGRSRHLPEKLRLLMIDHFSRMIINQLRSTLESRSPAFKQYSPFKTYLHKSYPEFIEYVTSTGKTSITLDRIIHTYLMPLRIWTTILRQMDPKVEVNLGQDMLRFLDLQVRKGIKEEIIYNWIYVIHLTFEELGLENRNLLHQVFIKKQVQDWTSGKGSLIPQAYLDVAKLKLVSNWLGNEVKSSFSRNHEILNIPPVPKFSASDAKKGFKDISSKSSFQKVSKSPPLPASPDSTLELVSKDQHLSTPSTSLQVEHLTPVPKNSNPNLELNSQEISPAPKKHSFFETSMPVPKNSNPNLELNSQEISPAPKKHSFFETSMPVPKNSNPSRESDPQGIPQAPARHPFFQNSRPGPAFSNLGSSSEDLHISQPSDSLQVIRNTPSPLSPVPRFSESSLEQFFEPTLKSRPITSFQVDKDQEKEIDGFLNDHDFGYDYDRSHLENLMKPSKRAKLHE